MANRKKSAFFGVISSQAYTILLVLINLATLPIILKTLQPAIYGLSVIIFQITSYLGLFDFGLTAGIERFLAHTREDTKENRQRINKIISTSILVYLIIAFFIIIIGNTFSFFIDQIFDISPQLTHSVRYIIGILTVILGGQIILRPLSGVFFAHQKQFLFNTLSFVLAISNILLTVLFVTHGYGLWSFAYSQIGVFIINVILNTYFFRRYYPHIHISFKQFDFVLVKEMLSYGFSLFLTGIAVQIIFQTDRIVLGSLVSLVAVSVYSFNAKIPELTSQLLWKITDNSFPALVELSEKEPKRLLEAHNRIMTLTMSLTTIIFWILLMLGSCFIKLWIGERYFAGASFNVLVCFLYLIQLTFIHITSVCLNGLGVAKHIAIMALIEAGVNLTLSIILAKLYGINGVLLGTIIGSLLTSFWFIPYLAVKYLKTSILSYVVNILKPVFFCSIAGGIVYLVFKNFIIIGNTWFQFSFYLMIIALVLSIPVFFLNKSLIKEMKMKVFQKG